MTGDEPPKGLHFVDHPLRLALLDEVHARPFAALDPPESASHLALVSGEHGAAVDFAHLVRLCHLYGVSPPAEGSRHFTCDFGTFRLKWERHAEFCTYTFFLPRPLRATFFNPRDLDCAPRVVRGPPWKPARSCPCRGRAAQRTALVSVGFGGTFPIRDTFWQSCFRRSGLGVDGLCRP